MWDDAYTGLMPQSILDDRRDETEARVGRWRTILTTGLEGDRGNETYVADTGEGLAGFASAGPGRDDDLDIALELKALYVRASRWGTGLGYALFQRSVGDRDAYLWVLAGNERAIAFYERQGFHLDGTSDEHDEGLHVRMVRAGA